MAHMRHSDNSKGTRLATLLVGGAIAIALAMALPTSAYAWNTPSGGFHGGGFHGGGFHGGGFHDGCFHCGSFDHFHGHSHSFNSFSLSVIAPLYSGPAYYPYPYPVYYPPPPVYYAPPPVVVVPQSTACRQGQWRQSDGSIVSGTACLGADGNWRLAS